MKAVYIKAPFTFEVKDVKLRDIKADEVLVKVKACSVCGHDIIMGSYADHLQPFGHEIGGLVEKTGPLVKNVKAGDRVALESGTFDRFSDSSRNGRVDLDSKGPNFWLKDEDTMGFAEYIIAPCETCVKTGDLSFEEASLIEPLGVAYDLVKTADIQLGDDVLVIGLGPLGLLASRLARARGARRVYGSELSACKARIAFAKKWGADDVICPDLESLADHAFPKGGVDRVLVTAPPATIPDALKICNIGGIVAFLGIDYGPGGNVTFDSNMFHVNKLQLRSSFASPALYFPACIELVKSGVVKSAEMVTHRFALEDTGKAIVDFTKDKENGIKAVMIND